jgi:hypothetical protein
MRDVDLSLFDFDYDLTWMGFFLGPGERVYGRYGGRAAESADDRVSVAGLCHALEAALKQHRARPPAPDREPAGRNRVTVAQYSAFTRLPVNACVHCHQVYDLRRESLQAAGRWSLDEVWVYPQPENVGLSMQIDRGDLVGRVSARSPADRAGLQAGDRLSKVAGQGIASIADLQYALHTARAARSLQVAVERGGVERTVTLELPEGWRKTDVSWRWSLKGLDPVPPVRGDDLSAEEKAALGLGPKRLAFRQGPFVLPEAEQAGVRQNDVIAGIDGKEPEMNARQFAAYVRLEHKVGDRVALNLLRGGKRLDVTVVLTGRSSRW